MHWWRDTLFKRLFLLMWVALVASHFAAWLLVTQVPGFGSPQPSTRPPPSMGAPGGAPIGAPGGAPGGSPPRPTFPSLPPTPGVPQVPKASHGPPGSPGAPAPSLPTHLLVLDYGVRLLLIGLAAWVGARWLAGPVRRLVEAARTLGSSLGSNTRPPRLRTPGATVEVQEAEQVFNEMAEQLHGQFRSRGLLMASVSHDLRTPLTRMRIRLEALREQPGVQRCIEDIREMDALIDTALQVFRDSAADEPLQPTDVFALVQSLTDDLLEQGQPVTLQGDNVVVPARAVALRRVVSNLLGNALRYGHRADVQVRPDAGGVRLFIDDTGPGIPPAELERVFEPFYRVEASRSRASGGTGLGLYIARDLLQRQGGSLRLINRPIHEGGGLRAEVWLPGASS